MKLAYKPDWDEARQRYEAYWRREKMDRPLLWITAPKDDLPDEPYPQGPNDLEQRWMDLDYLAATNDYALRRTYYAAEALPIWSAGYPGHVALPTFYGCPFTLAPSTGWHDPILFDEKLDTSHVKLDRECKWWKWGDEMFARARDECAGKAIPAMGAIFGCGDTLAMLRGNHQMLLDLIDQPEAVCETELQFMDDWFEVYDHQNGILRANGGESATWFPFWAPGKHYAVQCDVAYGISPKNFRECFVPALKKWTDWLDYAIFHLDGTGAFHLVEEVCSVEGVGAVQVLPGAGQPGPLHFMDTCKTVQRMGKGLHIMISPEEIPTALEDLSSRGLFICTGAGSEAQAREIVETTEKLSVDRG